MNQKAIKQKLISAFLVHAEGHIRKHLANVEVLLSNPTGIGEHADIVGEIDCKSVDHAFPFVVSAHLDKIDERVFEVTSLNFFK